eukprot:gene24912-30098_t
MASAATLKDYGKAAVLYKHLSRRHAANPLFLRRNLAAGLRRSDEENDQHFLQVSFSIPAGSVNSTGNVSLFVIGRPCGASQYRSLGARFFSLYPRCHGSCKMQIDLLSTHVSGPLDDLFLLILWSGLDLGRSLHEEWMAGVLLAAAEGAVSELVHIYAPCPIALVDLSSLLLSSPLRPHGWRSRRASSLARFMHPLLAIGRETRIPLTKHLVPLAQANSSSDPVSSAVSETPDVWGICSVRLSSEDRTLVPAVRAATSAVRIKRARSVSNASARGLSGPSAGPEYPTQLPPLTGRVVYHLSSEGRVAAAPGGEREGLGCVWCAFRPPPPCDGPALALLLQHLHSCHRHLRCALRLDRRGVAHCLVSLSSSAGAAEGLPGPAQRGGKLVFSLGTAPYPAAAPQKLAPAANTNTQFAGPPSRAAPATSSSLERLLRLAGKKADGEAAGFFHLPAGQRVTRADLERYLCCAGPAASVRPPELNLRDYPLRAADALLEEFIEISVQERQLMQMWNAHVASQRVWSDRLLPLSCWVFCRRFAGAICAQGLRFNLLLHLLALHRFGLLAPEEVWRCLVEVFHEDSA